LVIKYALPAEAVSIWAYSLISIVVSLEDNLMRLFGSERIARIMDGMGHKEGEYIQSSIITKSIERAQKKVEQNNFGIRKRLLEYDDVMNKQRDVIYKRRKNALFGDHLKYDIENMISNLDKAKILVKALPFIKKYHNKTIVIKYGGSAMVNPAAREQFIQDIVLMKYVGINPVIVHGGGPEINEMLQKIGKESKFIDGNRVTDEETVEIVEMVLSGKVNKGIVADINKYGGKAAGLSGKDGNMVFVEKKFVEADGEKIDIGFVGEIKEINTEVIKLLESNDVIPVISSIGVDKNGQTYNINADYVAGAIAGKLQADRLVFLTDVDGILLDYNNKQTLIDEIDVKKVNDLIEREIISGGMLPKVTTCLDAIENGVENVVILNGKLEHSLLLELFTEEGAGTLIKK
ncbi:MAG: acetylglutamate kinase, partial [Leptotrichia hofstadii]